MGSAQQRRRHDVCGGPNFGGIEARLAEHPPPQTAVATASSKETAAVLRNTLFESRPLNRDSCSRQRVWRARRSASPPPPPAHPLSQSGCRRQR